MKALLFQPLAWLHEPVSKDRDEYDIKYYPF